MALDMEDVNVDATLINKFACNNPDPHGDAYDQGDGVIPLVASELRESFFGGTGGGNALADELRLDNRNSSAAVLLPQHAMTAMSVVALYQTHEDEGLNTSQVSKIMELHGPNVVSSNSGCFSCACCNSNPLQLPETTNVIRDGKKMLVSTSLIVPGDLVEVNGGDVITADLRLISDDKAVRMDNSAITSDATPVTRDSEATMASVELLEATNVLFCGARCLSGDALAVAVSTGNTTLLAEKLHSVPASKSECVVS